MKIRKHKDLEVYKLAFETAMEIFELTTLFPKEERYSLTDQIRRSSRSVAANIAEAFRKRRYPKAFISKLSDSEGEAAQSPGRPIAQSPGCTIVNKNMNSLIL